MNLNQYIENISKRYKLGNSTEHTFRSDLQVLIESLIPDIRATNEPKRQACGAPDYILTKNDIPVGFIEAKDIDDKDLAGEKKNGNKEQFDRYKSSLNNIIFTDYLNFYLFRDKAIVSKVAIAEIKNGAIVPLTENFTTFTNLLKDFCNHRGQTIKTALELAQMMAGKARLLSDVLEKSLVSDESKQEDSTIKDQLIAFSKILIPDIKPKEFADVYAQTIAYGMFAARFHDTTLDTFSRQEAAELIPKSNPFLRKLFSYIAGPDIDDRIKWIVDSLADIFLACNVELLLKDYGKSTSTEDPIIHFYETFLTEYDPRLRKARGVWYTPQPVVEFIVRAVDDILKEDFNLAQGLVDNSKTKIEFSQRGIIKEQEVHKVQILDPATGTGTFLSEVVKQIHNKFQGQEGIWSSYVENHLLPRLNGFEILMASYAMAHLKLDLQLTESGFKPQSNQRMRVYLTNSLEESHTEMETYFANWLSEEANLANQIKRDIPVMCIIGNPPYLGESKNQGKWIMSLMEDYKKEPGGKLKLNERNPKWINDDYVKFIRYGQHYIEKNGSGVLAYICPHGFLDNPTFRGMRWNLLKTYDKIYTIDLHGNSKKKEVSPDGTNDVNVFNIEQGVSINIFVKTGTKKPDDLGKVFHFDLFGKREAKFEFLRKKTLAKIKFNKLPNVAPNYFFVKKNFSEQKIYSKGFKINELFEVNSVGIATAKDEILINYKDTYLLENVKKHFNLTPVSNFIQIINYRPFDLRKIYYNTSLVERARLNVMQNLINHENICLITNKQIRIKHIAHTFVSKNIVDLHITETANANPYIFPLYIYPSKPKSKTSNYSINDSYTYVVKEPDLFYGNEQLEFSPSESGGKGKTKTPERTPNLNMEIVQQIANLIELKFTNEKYTSAGSATTKDTFSPIDILDYIYAVLHSLKYREKYKEFLKIDFPRVPYPKDKITFWKLVKLGGEIRQIHLLESPTVEKFKTKYPISGNNEVTKPSFTGGKVYINDTQYFENVPEVAWNFYIGGYQPAQKWLKDRKSRNLEFDDILHYQKIIVALTETDRLMKEIDTIDFE